MEEGTAGKEGMLGNHEEWNETANSLILMHIKSGTQEGYFEELVETFQCENNHRWEHANASESADCIKHWQFIECVWSSVCLNSASKERNESNQRVTQVR